MRRKKIDVVIIGAGPAGLAAAVAVKRSGVKDLLLVERNDFLGGILLQCIHDGFGLHLYDRMLSGPQYAERLIEELEREGVSYLTNSMVVGIDRDRLVTIAGRSG
ncbi:FAD-dependent oxidoreductase, partial [Candidatus Bipolaricaulota bacterium]|nr:FAD-dependent oxidoreductase [Candidatus Bipolaricaulota bacterium]